MMQLRELSDDELPEVVGAALRAAAERIQGNERRAIARLELVAAEFGIRAAFHVRYGFAGLAAEEAHRAWSCALDARGWREL